MSSNAPPSPTNQSTPQDQASTEDSINAQNSQGFNNRPSAPVGL